MGERYVMLKVYLLEYSSYELNKNYIRYVIQSDSINHFDRNGPLKLNYDCGETQPSFKTTTLLLNFVEYETDKGIFFSNNKIYRGIQLYNQQDKNPMNYVKNIIERDYEFDTAEPVTEEADLILLLRINGKSFERYKRTYPKLQSLFADVISTIQLVLLIYEILSSNIYSNRMRVEIIKRVLSKINYDDEIKIKSNNKKEEEYKNKRIKSIYHSTNVYKENRKNEEIKDNNNSSTLHNFEENTEPVRQINKNKIKGKIINGRSENKNKNLLLERMNKINFWNILFYEFSCCCFKKEKKIIKKCKQLIDKEISVDNIIYKMLQLRDKKKLNVSKVSEVIELKQIIDLLEPT